MEEKGVKVFNEFWIGVYGMFIIFVYLKNFNGVLIEFMESLKVGY